MIPGIRWSPDIRWSPGIRWSPAIRWSIRSMDFDKPKVYGDTFISDGLVCLGACKPGLWELKINFFVILTPKIRLSICLPLAWHKRKYDATPQRLQSKVHGDGVARDCGGAAGRRPDGAQHLAQGVDFLNPNKYIQHLTTSCIRGSASPRPWRPLQGHVSAPLHSALQWCQWWCVVTLYSWN